MTAQEVYAGSNGAETKTLYARLVERAGAAGGVAMNLFRASKCSARAKKYRGGIRGQGSYRQMAYDRKNWAMQQLCEILTVHAERLGILWGWQKDEVQEFHKWVLYVELPAQGQVSFHSAERYGGPDYPGEWDGLMNASEGRVIAYCDSLLEASACPLKL